jgi:predicted ATPase
VPADATERWSGAAGLARGGLVAAPGVVGASPAAVSAIGTICAEWAERFGRLADGARMSSDALVDVLRVSCEEAPVVLMVDDAQWLDGASLAALSQAARALAALPLTIVLTVQQHAERTELDELRSRVGRELAGVAVSLGALDPDAISSFARRLLPDWEEESVARLTRRVSADSAGNPLFALELLRAITNGLDLGRLRSAWPEPNKTFDQSFPGELPDSVAAAIRVNFRRLSPEAQRLLAAASVLSDRNEEALLARAADLDQTRARPALDELERQQWLLDDGRGYSFRARLVRDVIARDMLTSGQRRRVLERAAAT